MTQVTQKEVTLEDVRAEHDLLINEMQSAEARLGEAQAGLKVLSEQLEQLTEERLEVELGLDERKKEVKIYAEKFLELKKQFQAAEDSFAEMLAAREVARIESEKILNDQREKILAENREVVGQSESLKLQIRKFRIEETLALNDVEELSARRLELANEIKDLEVKKEASVTFIETAEKMKDELVELNKTKQAVMAEIVELELKLRTETQTLQELKEYSRLETEALRKERTETEESMRQLKLEAEKNTKILSAIEQKLKREKREAEDKQINTYLNGKN